MTDYADLTLEQIKGQIRTSKNQSDLEETLAQLNTEADRLRSTINDVSRKIVSEGLSKRQAEILIQASTRLSHISLLSSQVIGRAWTAV